MTSQAEAAAVDIIKELHSSGKAYLLFFKAKRALLVLSASDTDVRTLLIPMHP